MEPSNAPREERRNKCCYCNAQICSSYVLGMFACVLVIGGVYLAFHKWDYMWLVVSAIGIALILVGALLHFCGSNTKKRDTRARHTTNEQDLHEHLLPTAPPLNNAYSVSQLSINMLPPYFSALDNVLTSSQPFPSAPPNSDNVSQIVQIKGQSFILLPISENVIPSDNESIARWSNQMNAPKDQSNRQNVPKAEHSTTVPVTEDCGCQTEAFSLHQVTQTSENGIQTLVTPCRESCEVQTIPAIEDDPINESSVTNANLFTEDLHMEVRDPVNQSVDAIANCDVLPNEACNSESLPVVIEDEDLSNSTNETQMETMESGESTESLSTNCQTQVSSSEERFSVSTDDDDTAINVNMFLHNIPSLDNLGQSTSLPLSTDISPDSVSPLSNNSLPENYSITMDHINDNRVSTDGETVDINENYSEPSTTVIDIVNNNDTCVSNSHSMQTNECSVIGDSNHDTVGHSTYSVTALLGTNENYIEQYSENVSDIDDADICDRSSPPPSYEEVTQENLQSTGHGIAYHGTV